MNNKMSLSMEYEYGALPYVLNAIESLNIDIVSMSQDIPISNVANADFILNLNNTNSEEFFNYMKSIKGIENIIEL